MLRRNTGPTDEAERKLNRPSFVQPALFVVEYALARLCMAWGIAPRALIGYSLGEYTAACLAGIFSLEDALRLVAVRARMIEGLPTGAMLAVALPEAEARRELGEELALAAVNGPSLCVVSGGAESVADLERRLTEAGVASRRLNASHAFHSKFMEPLVGPLVELLKEIKLSPPRIPCVSNLTGRWITPEEATDPNFLARQLCQTVRFYEGVSELLKEPGRVLLEVGPGQTLSSMAIQMLARDGGGEQGVFPLMRHSYDNQHDTAYMLRAVAQLWLSGADVNPKGFYAGERRRRVTLPTYPFERRRYWIEARKAQAWDTPAAEPFAQALADADGAAHAEASPAPERPAEAGSPLPLHTRANLRNPYVAPSSPTEARLAQIWQELLGVERVGVHDNLFELGAHSLLAAQFVARLREAFPVEPSLRTIYEAPTVGELAMVVEEMLIAKIEQLSDSEVERLMSER